MAFLSGSFFPLDSAPSWIQTVSKFLPLGQLNEAMIGVLAMGEGLGSIMGAVVALLATAVVFFLIATKVFRWETA
jgi:ABC-2 type transport system permease protein